MTGQRDIERTLDAWFVDGPSVMPDRLFDAVLDQVEHTPQRPLARLRLRLTDMNPRIRMYTALAAALLVALAAIAIIGGGSQTSVRETSGPTRTPTGSPPAASAVEVPDQLAAVWMGAHRDIPGVDPDAGVTLVFTDSAFHMTQSAGNPVELLVAVAQAVESDVVRLVSPSGVRDCEGGDVGDYRWSLSPSGETLELTLVSDECELRSQAAPGTYWLMNCPTSDDNCIGPVDAGTYGSQFIDPFIPADDPWTPRYGAVQYTVAADWVNASDFPTELRLQAPDATDNATIHVFSDIVALNEADQCVADPEPSVGRTAEELKDWIVQLEGVAATRPDEVAIGGLDGWRLDVSIDPEWTETCPFSAGLPSRGLFVGSLPESDFHWGIPSGGSMRLWLLDLGDGRALLVDYEADTQAAFDAGLADATTVVESFVFTR